MNGINAITILGKLGADGELAYTKSGAPVLKFSVATNKNSKDVQVTQWHRCVAFGEWVPKYQPRARKGATVLVLGEMSYRSYKNRDGIEKDVAEVLVNRMFFWDKNEVPKDDALPPPAGQVDEWPFE